MYTFYIYIKIIPHFIPLNGPLSDLILLIYVKRSFYFFLNNFFFIFYFLQPHLPALPTVAAAAWAPREIPQVPVLTTTAPRAPPPRSTPRRWRHAPSHPCRAWGRITSATPAWGTPTTSRARGVLCPDTKVWGARAADPGYPRTTPCHPTRSTRCHPCTPSWDSTDTCQVSGKLLDTLTLCWPNAGPASQPGSAY